MAPAALDLLHVLAYLYLRFGQHRRALALLRVAAVQFPRNRGTLSLLAYALVLNKTPDEALVVIEELVQLEPNCRLTARLLESQALLLQGRETDARQCFQQFVALRSAGREKDEAQTPGSGTGTEGWLA